MNVSFQPDPLPLREGLRRLRYIVRRGGETARDVARGAMKPNDTCIASRFGSAMITEIERIAEGFDQVAKRAARRAFGHEEDLTTTLDDLHGSVSSAPFLASTLYTAINLVLKHIGAESLFVSELSAREAMRQWQAMPGRQQAGDARLAAWLANQLLGHQVIRGSYINAHCVVAADLVKPVAIFAVMLWLLVVRSPEESEAALISAADIATAIADRIGPVFAADDEADLVALLEKYRNNV